MEIQVGDKFYCIKDVQMEYTNGKKSEIAYVKGKTYISEHKGCITDEQGIKSHVWSTSNGLVEEFKDYFSMTIPKKEVRIYLIKRRDILAYYDSLDDEQFIQQAENEGMVFTLKGYENFNNEERCSIIDYIVRFIEVVTFD